MLNSVRMNSARRICWLLALTMLLAAWPMGALAEAGDEVRCKVTSEKATLYAAMDVDQPLLAYYTQGAEFTAYETGDDGWLSVIARVQGESRRCYVSILDLAVTYSDREDSEDSIAIGLGDGGYLPPDEVGEVNPSGLQLEGVLQSYVARSEKTYIFAEPDLEATRLSHYTDGQKFQGVMMEDGQWVKVIIAVDGVEQYGYVPYGRVQLPGSSETKSSNKVIIRITSGVITVYSKPNKSSQQLGVVTAPVRFEGVKSKSGKWVRVELEGDDMPKYGYIEAKYISN